MGSLDTPASKEMHQKWKIFKCSNKYIDNYEVAFMRAMVEQTKFRQPGKRSMLE